jgi:hypothetical protein
MTKRFGILALTFALAAGGFAQIGYAGPSGLADPVPSSVQSGFAFPLASGDMVKLRDLSARDRAKAKDDTAKLLRAIQLSCEPTDAALIGRGKGNSNGKVAAVRAYEVACSNHAGYILVSQDSQKPIAISCFAANAMHIARDSKDQSPDLYCELTANKDLKSMAASLMAAAGTMCAVNEFRWFGQNALTQADYSEAACADGKGYLLKIAQTGPAAEVSVIGCQDAAKRGLKCRLTDGGPVTSQVTLQTFRDALKQNNVNCEPTNMRVIGRESVDRRYVVEVKCQEQPNGLVAFIPTAGNSKAFEALDCAAAVEREVRCEL